jgi:hypothetical protein
MGTTFETLFGIVLVILLVIGVFLMIRRLNLWYWKIEERIEIEKEQLRVQREILSNIQDFRSELEVQKKKKYKRDDW